MPDWIALDTATTLWINHHHYVVLDAILRPVSSFGEGGFGWIAVAAVLLALGGKRERLTTALFITGLLVLEYGLMPSMRHLWPRTRPYLCLPNIRQLGVPWDKPSFPSAHAHMWALATVLFGSVYRRWIGPLVALTLLTLYSRPYLGMHYVGDVLAGAVLGLLVGLPLLWVARKLGLLDQTAAREPGADPGLIGPPGQPAPD